MADFMLHELQHDRIIFDHAGYRKALGIFNKHYLVQEKHTPLDTGLFMNIEDDDIKKRVIDILATPYALANWGMHKITVVMEEDILKRSVQTAIYSLKMRRLEMMISDNQKQIRESSSEEDILTLISEQKSLLDAKMAFSEQLGRVVIK